MKVLYVDDSGKVHANDHSKVAVFGGFSIDEGKWHQFVRQISGAKALHFPDRPKPYD